MSEGLWVFGYGSLMWRPGFPHQRRHHGYLTGMSRRLCILSVHHRGTEERPGLVLGLDRGGACHGITYYVEENHVEATLDYLKAREQVNGVYREAHVWIEFMDEPAGEWRTVQALTYIAERSHPSYVGSLPISHQARIVLGARGISGHNVDYVLSTLSNLHAKGIRDRELERLAVTLGPIMKHRCAGQRVSDEQRYGSIVPHALPRTLRFRSLRPEQRRRFAHRKAIRL